MKKSYNRLTAEKSPSYRPAAWSTFDRDGNPIRRVVYAGRGYTEYRYPSGETQVELHGREDR